MQKITASQIIEQLGEAVLIDRLGFSERNLRHARTTGHFAGGWYREIKSLCDEHGVFCPLSAFSWKVPDKKLGYSKQGFQGEAAE